MQTAPGRHWCFTINNPLAADDPRLWLGCTYVVWQLEEGADARTQHYQGYVCFESKKRLTAVKQINERAHWEKCKGSPAQNKAYCTKTEGRVHGPWEVGILPLTGGEAEKAKWQRIIKDAKAGDLAAIEDYAPRESVIYHRQLTARREWDTATLPTIDARWFYGASGTGKSSEARKLFPAAYIKMANKWWDGYNGEDAVIIEDLAPQHEYLDYFLKIWADHYAFRAERKGGSLFIRPKTIIVTSNYTIDACFPKVGRSRAARRA